MASVRADTGIRAASPSPRPLRFGLSLSNRAVLFGMPVEVLLDMARTADASPLIDSIWVGDNLLSKPRVESTVVLSALAVLTNRVRLGTICYASFPYRHPLIVAIQWASLDVLSGGRTVLGLCAGAGASLTPKFGAESRNMGVADNERWPRLEEGLELLRRFWTEDALTHEGRFWTFEAANALPKPAQERVPILIGVSPRASWGEKTLERTLRRIARLADGWQVDGTPAPAFAENWRRIRAYAEEEGRADQVTESCFHLMVNINEDVNAARAESVEYLGRYYGQGYVSPEKLEAWLAAGPPSAVIDKIGALVDAGCTTPVLRFTAMNPKAHLERCIDEVLPAFQQRMAKSAGLPVAVVAG